MKRLLALILSVALVLSVCALASCGDTSEETTTASSTPKETTSATTEGDKPAGETTTNGGNQPEDTTKGGTTTPEDTTTVGGGEDPEDTTTVGGGDDPVDPSSYDYYNKLPGYEDVDFGGRVFKIATYEGSDEGGGGRWDNFREVYSDETDAISTSVRERNGVVERLYNCTIEIHKSTAPGSDAMAEVTANQHTIDIYSQQYTNTGIFTNDQSYNLYNLGIDFSNPWWDQQWVKSFTLKNANGVDTMYAAVGDFAFNSFSATSVMFYNKNLYEQKLSDVDIYQLVRDKEWTIDKFLEILKRDGMANDANGNSEYLYADGDILSWVRVAQVTHALHVASGLSIVANVDGALVFDPAQNTNAWVDVVNKSIEAYNVVGADTISYSDVQDAVTGNKALFASEVLDVLERMKDADVSVGLVPVPMFSETQENYAHYVDNHFCTYSVPISVPDPETVGEFFELYAFHSKGIVREAYINTYCVEYCGDADSAEMLDIILDSRTYDPGYLWWPAYETDITNMITGGTNNMTQWIGRKGATLVSNIKTFMDQLNDNKN